ncbi:lysis protein [Cronobacter sakazakii]|nr:lysis protein [Cronobacter sakazakii]
MATLWGFVRTWWKPLLFVVAVGMVFYYRSALTKKEVSLTEVNRELNLVKDGIADMQRRQISIATLDAKYTGELADAKATIDQLERDVAFGKRRLQLNATCKNLSTSGTTSLDDAASPGLTDSAEQSYFTLRSRIELAGKQIAGLQDYIREQCLK